LALWALAEDWTPIWADLARWRALPAEERAALPLGVELARLANEREASARQRKDRAEEFRARVLRAQLARGRGESPAALGAPRSALRYFPGEARWVVEVLANGPERVRAAREAWSDSTPGSREAVIPWLPEIVRAERQALRFELALELSSLARGSSDLLAEERVRALAQSGALGEARAEFEALAPATQDYRLLAELCLASGEQARARRVLGRALAAGLPGAELALAERECAEGRLGLGLELSERALAQAPEDPRAWRSFSLALLPPPRANLGSGSPVLQPEPSTSGDRRPTQP
jgi:hypothetical protein